MGRRTKKRWRLGAGALACAALIGCSGAIEAEPFTGASAPVTEPAAVGDSPPPPPPVVAGSGGLAPSAEPTLDAGADPAGMSAGSSAPPTSIFDVEAACTSDYYWDDKEEYDGDRRMHPGRACISCHADHDGPSFAIGGTVFPSAHEPDQCYGVDGEDDEDMFVVITDATGRVARLPVNVAGNFESEDYEHELVMPIRAKVVRGEREREMLGERMTGDCNGCHTQDGANGAPGRIIAP